MTMTDEHKALYIRLRGEIIKHFQETRNANHFKEGYRIELAESIAKHQLECDLRSGDLRLSMEDMLLYTPEECCTICENKLKKRFAKLLSV